MGRNNVTYCVKGLGTFSGSLWAIEATKKSYKLYLGEPSFLGPVGPNFKMGISRLPNKIQSPITTTLKARNGHIQGVEYGFKVVSLTISKILAKNAIWLPILGSNEIRTTNNFHGCGMVAFKGV